MVDGITEAYGSADLILRVTPPSPEEIAALPEGSVLIGLLKPFEDKARLAALNARKITAFALELLPRISRAQSMDALSSQGACAGYQCGLIAAARCTKFFPMLTNAAGTIRPARVLVIGAGVAGLQAIATCKRLGAMVEAYDVRSAAREQIESLGAKFVDTGVSADGAGGYARELTADEKAQQAEKLAKAVALSDVVITTAAIPGKKAPLIITADMVGRMKYGAIIVDMAAESGGNCALTRPGEHVVANDVNIRPAQPAVPHADPRLRDVRQEPVQLPLAVDQGWRTRLRLERRGRRRHRAHAQGRRRTRSHARPSTQSAWENA